MALISPWDALTATAAPATIGASQDSDSCFLTPALFSEEDDLFLMALMDKSSPLSPFYTIPPPTSDYTSSSAPSIQPETITPNGLDEAAEPSTSFKSDKGEHVKKKKARAAPVRTSAPRPSNAWILYRSAKIKEQQTSEWQEQHAVFKNMCDLSTLFSSASSSSSSSAIATSSTLASPAATAPETTAAEASSSSSSSRYSQQYNNAAGQTLQAFVTKCIADRWRTESQEVKDYYYELSKRKKLEHAQMYPDYKFTPRKAVPAPATPPPAEKEAEGAEEETRETDNAATTIIEKQRTPASKGRAATSRSTAKASPSSSSPNPSQGPIKAKRKAKTKTKPKPPGLCIDVQAAEGLASLDREVDASVSQSQSNLKTDPLSSAFAPAPATAAPSPYLFDLDEDVFGPFCNPVNLTLSRGTSSVVSGSTLDEHGTLTLDVLMRDVLPSEETTLSPTVDLAADVNEGIAEDCASTSVLTEIETTRKEIQAEVRTTPPRLAAHHSKKTTSSLTKAKQQSSHHHQSLYPALLSPTKKSPKRRLKKALICKDAAKIAKSKALEEELAQQRARCPKSWQTMPVFYTQQEHPSVAQDGEEETSLLIQSYDPQSASSEVEEALLCADSLIESFAGIAAWKADPSTTAPWLNQASNPILLFPQQQQSAPPPQEEDPREQKTTESAPARLATFNSNNWRFYSQPVADLLGQKMFTATGASSQQQQQQQQTEGDMLLDELDMAGIVTSEEDSAHPSITNMPSSSLVDTAGSSGWDMKEEEWEALLRQTVSAPAPATTTDGQGAAPDQQRESLITSMPTPNDEGVWDLVSLVSHPCSVDGRAEMSTSSSSSFSPSSSISSSARFWRSERDKQNRNVVELHGTYTEEELMSKLKLLREAKSRSAATPG